MRCCVIFFFFSSRRRHTRFDCDWSSDVCSSDLKAAASGERTDDRSHTMPTSRDGLGGGSGHRRVLASGGPSTRSEEHTSELQSQSNIVCRLLLEKKERTAMRSSADGTAGASPLGKSR